MPDPARDPDYVLTLRPLPDAVPACVRLRRAIKCLLRSFGFRVLRIEPELPAIAAEPAGAERGQADAAEGAGVMP